MNDEEELHPKTMGFISSNFVKVADLLKEASYQLRSRNISKFPIFVLCDQPNPVGHILLEKGHMELGVLINFSTVEEFEQRALITDEGRKDFEENYKDPDEYACLFVVLPDFIHFVYLPYPEDLSQDFSGVGMN